MADFFTKDTEHGWLKRVIYKKYLQAYVAKILRTQLDVVIIDGFAGQGRYGTEWGSDIESYGSSLIIVMVVLQFYCMSDATWKSLHGAAIHRLKSKSTNEHEEVGDIGERLHGLSLDGAAKHRVKDKEDVSDAKLPDKGETCIYLIEAKRKNFQALRINILDYLNAFMNPSALVNISENDDVNISVQECNKRFPISIFLQRSKFDEFIPPTRGYKSRTLTILDPFGYSSIPMQHVHRFLDAYSEVLISFMSSYVNRFCETKGSAAVAKLYGIDLDTERSTKSNLREFARIVRDDAEAEKPKSCTRSYIKHLKARTGAEYAQFYEMRGNRNNVIYHLIHFTNHIKGLEAMKETFNTCTQYEDDFKMSDYRVLVEGIPLVLGNSQNKEELANAIFKEYRGKTVRLENVEEYVLLHTPFVFRKGALKLLEKAADPKIIGVVDEKKHDEERKRRRWTYPDWGRWILTFRDEA